MIEKFDLTKKNTSKKIKLKFTLLLILIIFTILFKVNKYYPEQYLKICNNTILLFKKKYQKVLKPKISVISPVYNKEKSILRFLRSVQNQNFKSIEIILVDDCSQDNSSGVIEEYQKEDRRIILLKHKKNRGTLISRNEGVLVSKGEYLIFGDPDDILIKDILKYSFKIAKKGDYDIVRYNAYRGNGNIVLYHLLEKIKKNPVYQPELSLFLYYGINGNFKQNDFYIWNKLIKRKTFITSINSIDKYYLNQFMIDCEDGLMNFILHKKANSLYYIKQLGYYYIKNKKCITPKFLEWTSKTFRHDTFFFIYTFSIKNYIQNNSLLNNNIILIY